MSLTEGTDKLVTVNSEPETSASASSATPATEDATPASMPTANDLHGSAPTTPQVPDQPATTTTTATTTSSGSGSGSGGKGGGSGSGSGSGSGGKTTTTVAHSEPSTSAPAPSTTDGTTTLHPEHQVISGIGGSITVDLKADGLVLSNKSPNEGFTTLVNDARHRHIQVQFRSNDHLTTIDVYLDRSGHIDAAPVQEDTISSGSGGAGGFNDGGGSHDGGDGGQRSDGSLVPPSDGTTATTTPSW